MKQFLIASGVMASLAIAAPTVTSSVVNSYLHRVDMPISSNLNPFNAVNAQVLLNSTGKNVNAFGYDSKGVVSFKGTHTGTGNFSKCMMELPISDGNSYILTGYQNNPNPVMLSADAVSFGEYNGYYPHFTFPSSVFTGVVNRFVSFGMKQEYAYGIQDGAITPIGSKGVELIDAVKLKGLNNLSVTQDSSTYMGIHESALSLIVRAKNGTLSVSQSVVTDYDDKPIPAHGEAAVTPDSIWHLIPGPMLQNLLAVKTAPAMGGMTMGKPFQAFDTTGYHHDAVTVSQMSLTSAAVSPTALPGFNGYAVAAVLKYSVDRQVYFFVQLFDMDKARGSLSPVWASNPVKLESGAVDLPLAFFSKGVKASDSASVTTSVYVCSQTDSLTPEGSAIYAFPLSVKDASISISKKPFMKIQMGAALAGNVLSLTIPAGGAKLELYTLNGQRVFSKELSEAGIQSIEIPQLARGTYLAQVASKTASLTEKIVLE